MLCLKKERGCTAKTKRSPLTKAEKRKERKKGDEMGDEENKKEKIRMALTVRHVLNGLSSGLARKIYPCQEPLATSTSSRNLSRT